MFVEFLATNSIIWVLVAIVVISFCLSMFGFIGNININAGGGNINISGSNAENEFVAEFSENIDASDAASLVINNPVGNVLVKTTGENKVTLVKKLYLPKQTSEEEKKNIKTTLEKSVLKKEGNKIELNVPRLVVLSVFTAKVDLEIAVPKNFSLNQSPGVNDITVEDLEGSVDLTSNVGNITLRRLAGPVSAHANSGNISGHEIKNISSLTVNAGNISVSSVEIGNGDANILSQVGNVQVDINEVAQGANCQIKSNTGEVSVMLNRQANVSIEAVTNMGQLDVDQNINVISKGPGFMGGSIVGVLNQPGGKLNITSNTGGVKVHLK